MSISVFKWSIRAELLRTKQNYLSSNAFAFSSTPYPPPHLLSTSSGFRDPSNSRKTTRWILPLNSHCCPLQSTTPCPPLLTASKPTTVQWFTPSGMNFGSPSPLTNSEQLKKIPILWSFFDQGSCHDKIILTWLRISNTRLTHSFLHLGIFSLPSSVLLWR